MYIIVSWFTKDTPYEEVMNTYLRPSLEKLDIPYKIYPVEPLKNWRQNTNLKPQIVEQALNEINTNILVVDADAKIHDYPVLLNEIPKEYDCGLFYLNWNEWYKNGSDKIELCSGSMYFRNRPICKELVRTWKEIAKKNENHYTDQQNLELALKKFPELKIYKLPYSYCWINSLPKGQKHNVERPEKVIIEHHQISRTLRNKV